MNGLGACFIRQDGQWLSGSPQMNAVTRRWDHGMTRELYRQLATNIYKTKDGRWYSLHGSMNPTPLLTMLGVPQHNENNLKWPEIIQMYSDLVQDLDSETVDNWSNNVYRVPGTICYEQEEFEKTPHVSGAPLVGPFGPKFFLLARRLMHQTGESHQGRATL